MSQIEVPVGKRFVATVINSEGKEDCITVECVSTDITNKCSMCVFAEKKECAKYYCVERQRKDGESVYFREIDPGTRPLEREDKYTVVKDNDVSEETAIAENKESGNDCAENEENVILEDISLDKVKALREVIEGLFDLANFRQCCGDAIDIYRVKFYNLSGEMQAILPSILNKSFLEFIDKQVPIEIDKSVKELKNLLNEM
jgi:hypothetical protein